jgi:hypothetical protein
VFDYWLAGVKAAPVPQVDAPAGEDESD